MVHRFKLAYFMFAANEISNQIYSNYAIARLCQWKYTIFIVDKDFVLIPPFEVSFLEEEKK